jgi:hypothetical protein
MDETVYEGMRKIIIQEQTSKNYLMIINYVKKLKNTKHIRTDFDNYILNKINQILLGRNTLSST